MVQNMLWTNMGHSHNIWNHDVDQCRVACTFHGVRPKVVVSIREPYSYWRSLFTYAWYGVGSGLIINHPLWKPPKTTASHPGLRGVNSFLEFMRWANESEVGPGEAQARQLHISCGMPCVHDYLVHTETLAIDWLRLLAHLELPLIALPHMNPTSEVEKSVEGSHPPPRTVFTREIVDIVHRLDARMFNEFGYRQRAAGFELASRH